MELVHHLAPDEVSRAAEREDLQAFAERVKAAARGVPAAGRFGDDRVFLAALAARMRPRDLRAWCAALLASNRKRLLSLARADLVEAMGAELVRASELRSGPATFHFLAV